MKEFIKNIIDKVKTNDLLSKTEEDVLLNGQERFYITKLLTDEYLKVL